jgi:hypothetical protein
MARIIIESVRTTIIECDQVKEDEMGGTYSTHAMMRNSCSISAENLKLRDHMKDLGVNGKILL